MHEAEASATGGEEGARAAEAASEPAPPPVPGPATSAEVARLRAEAGLSLRELSRFLGFGEQTVARYERGDEPDLLHGNTARMAMSPEGARMLLHLNGHRISERSRARVERYIERLDSGELAWPAHEAERRGASSTARYDCRISNRAVCDAPAWQRMA